MHILTHSTVQYYFICLQIEKYQFSLLFLWHLLEQTSSVSGACVTALGTEVGLGREEKGSYC